MSKKGCFGEYNFGVSALAALVLHPAFILARQNLANNRPFAKFANFYSVQYFPLYGIGGVACGATPLNTLVNLIYIHRFAWVKIMLLVIK